MKILIACEESQRVCIAFREKGHEAQSCDLLTMSGGHPEWHIQSDVLPLINGNCEFTTYDGTKHAVDGRWDMIIAFPPCTDLTVTGARVFERKRADGTQRRSIEFFCQFLNADCDKIVIENPVGIISGEYIKRWFPDLCEKYGLPKSPAQIIQPWMFGDEVQKTTCLWEIGVNPLVPSNTVKPDIENFSWVDKKTGKIKKQNKWYYETSCLPKKDRALARSKTFPGIAKAMADQWG